MANFDIGISGLTAAQRSLEVIGNNIANAGTEGYHRQEVVLTPTIDNYTAGVFMGQGVDLTDVRRLYDEMVESQLLSQGSVLSSSSRKLETLKTVENVFGELSSDGLSTAMDSYFEALNELAADPSNTVYINKVVRFAEDMSYEFRRIGTFLSELEDNLQLEAQRTAGQINEYSSQIANLNENIQTAELRGGTAGNMRDERDLLITKLSELTDISTYTDQGLVSVFIAGTPVVMGTRSAEVKAELFMNNGELNLGIAPVGTDAYTSTITGGTLGAVFSLRNDLIAEVHGKLDLLAKTIVMETNKIHLQGVGFDGPFKELSGWGMNSSILTEYDPPVTDGSIYIRITDPTGTTTRAEIDVDVDVDTLEDIATKFNAIPGMDGCAVIGGQLTLFAEDGYKFDFQAGVDPEISLGAIPIGLGPNDAIPTISGIYTGSEDETYNAVIVGTGEVGLPGGPQVEITNQAGQLVAKLDLGEGYVAGEPLYIADGISVSFSDGQLSSGDMFFANAITNSDTSGLLAATGINCFFTGKSASTIGVVDKVVENPGQFAAAGGGEWTDGSIILKMAKVGDAKIEGLDNISPEDYYRKLSTTLGQMVDVAQTNQDNANSIVKQLSQQRDNISGVDINQEATQLLVFEKMYQAMAKYITTVSSTMDSLMSIL